MQLNPKDYVLSSGCYGAIVSHHTEDNKVLVTIRYIKDNSGETKKYSYEAATEYLKQHKPDYLFHSKALDVNIHAIPIDEIEEIYKPAETVNKLTKITNKDRKQAAAISAYELILESGIDANYLGITGSLMLGLHNEDSDIDMVVYDHESFHRIRYFLTEKMDNHHELKLSDEMWLDSYSRRNCEISFSEYVFHEQRKYNKFCINNTKVDISLVSDEGDSIIEIGPFIKKGREKIRAEIIDDMHAFDLPARYYIDNARIPEIVCHTATYIGQAFNGEKIEATGMVEVDQEGNQRLVIGTSREAKGEYIKVVS